MPIIKRPPSSSDRNEPHYTLRRSPSGAYYPDDDDRDDDRRTQRSSGGGRGRSFGSRVMLWFAGLIATLAIVGALIVGYALVVMAPQLPSLDALTNYQPKVPLRVFTADHVLIGEFGEERRSLVRFQDIPDVMKKAVLAIEDYRFYEHGGVDFVGILRAGVADLMHGGAREHDHDAGRAQLLPVEREDLHAQDLRNAARVQDREGPDEGPDSRAVHEPDLSRPALVRLRGRRTYFGKDLKDITLAEAAMLAGLPKAPSAYNPVVNPKRAKVRQEYILKRMLEVGYITQPQYDEAVKEEIHVRTPGNQYAVHGEYVAEMVRQMMYQQYKDETYTRGLTVTTTINSSDQEAAYQAVRRGILDYERRHGYRGPEASIKLPAAGDDRDEAIDDALADHRTTATCSRRSCCRHRRMRSRCSSSAARPRRSARPGCASAGALSPARTTRCASSRPVVRVLKDGKTGWQVVQLPQVEGALVAIAPQDGAIRSLVGGFDFNKSKFNHVTQAWRQPSFKPFIYSASLDKPGRRR